MIWTILITTVLTNLLALAVSSANERVHQATRAAVKRERKFRGGIVAGLLFMALGWTQATCWTVYAFQVEDWRFAAIAWVPIVAAWINQAVRGGD